MECIRRLKPVQSGGPAGRRSDDVRFRLGMLSVGMQNVKIEEEVGKSAIGGLSWSSRGDCLVRSDQERECQIVTGRSCTFN